MSPGKSCLQLQTVWKGKDGNRQIEPISIWLKLVAVFLANIVIAIPDSTIGIFYDYFIDRYNASHSAIGWVVSSYFVSGNLLGLVMSPLVSVYGCRLVAIVSSCIFALGMCLSPFAPTLPWLIVFYGILGGIGVGGYVLTTITIVQQLFTYNRGLATGISSLGFTAGTVLGPVVIEYFLSEYSLSGALLLHGALYVQAIVFSLFMRSPRSLLKGSSNKKQHSDADKIQGSLMDDNSEGMSDKFHKAVDICTEKDSDLQLNGKLEIYERDHNTSSNGKDRSRNENTVHDKSVLESDGIQLDSDSSLTTEKNVEITNSNKNKIRLVFKEIVNVSLLKEGTFLLCTLFATLTITARVGMFSQIVSAAIHRGNSTKESAYVVMIMGLSNLVFRIGSTIILNFKGVNPLWYTSFGVVCLAVSGFVAAFAHTYAMFVCSMVLMGAFEGISNTALPMVIVYIIGVPRFAQGFSILRVVQIPMLLVATPVAGWMVDVTGEYTATFILVGVLCCVAVFIILIVDLIIKRRRRRLPETDS